MGGWKIGLGVHFVGLGWEQDRPDCWTIIEKYMNNNWKIIDNSMNRNFKNGLLL